MTNQPTIYRDYDEWRSQRRLGASDSAGILGVGYSTQNAVSIWREKAFNERDEDEADELMRLTVGRLIEPALRTIFKHVTGKRVFIDGPHAIWTHQEFPWMTASLDGWCREDHKTVPVELKNVNQFLMNEWTGDEPPLRYMIQSQHQMAVVGADKAYVMGLIGGNQPVIKEVQRNDRFINALIEKLTEFWSYVERREMPPVDGSVVTSKVLSTLWPDEDETPVELPEEATIWDMTIEESKRHIKAAEAVKLDAENKLKAFLAESTSGILPDGSVYTWRNQTRKPYEVKEATFRVLRKSTNKWKFKHHQIKETEHASSDY